MSYAQQQCLVLTQGYEVHRVVSWQRAISLVFSGKAEELVSYDDEVTTVSLKIKLPAVIRLLKLIPRNKKAVRFSRANILGRDSYKCGYCGCQLTLSKMTYDHITPRQFGGKTDWFNIISACLPCNLKKRNRTPEEAGMRLLTKPYKPTSLPLLSLHLDLGKSIPDAWRSFVYWHGELEQT